MTFKVAARTLLHLGAELISSDGIAFYELIKNGLDAQSPEVRVTVVMRLDYKIYEKTLRTLDVWPSDEPSGGQWRGSASEDDEDDDDEEVEGRLTWEELLVNVRQSLVAGAPELDELEEALDAVDSSETLAEAVLQANYIEVSDDGVGMSLDDLEQVYMTIGTLNRVRQRKSDLAAGVRRVRPLLGEKGLGRLSAMRLGDRLLVQTARENDRRWNLLTIDWMRFAEAGDANLETIDVAPTVGTLKMPRTLQGTRIRISALKADWTRDRLESLVNAEFAKLADPFLPGAGLPVRPKFNGLPIPIPKFSDFIFSHAHGTLSAQYRVTRKGRPLLTGRAEYRLRGRNRTFRLSGIHLSTMADEASRATLRRVGPFKLEVYWFNRRLLTKIEGIGDLKTVRALVERWGGGVMVFRDGFRVHPYGGAADDWLDLDRDAFSTSGFKVNRGQIVGKVDITQEGNPFLVDQTNREGLRDGPEKAAFVALVAGVMEKQFRGFLVAVDDDIKRAERLTLNEVTERVDEEDQRIRGVLEQLLAALPEHKEAKSLVIDIRESLEAIKNLNEQVRLSAESYDRERSRLVHLASIGLMIEVLAHELLRATASGLRTVAEARRSGNLAAINRSLAVLDAQLRTLQKRLKVLDPLSTNARQTKEEFEVVDWVRSIVATFSGQAGRERINFTVTAVPKNGLLPVRAVKGMFVQVIENLLTNSVYWIEQQRRYTGEFEGLIDVVVDCRDCVIRVTDNGPGIPADRREVVFEPFFSTKPKKEGRGLGLYIAREIAEYHGGRLSLADAADGGSALRTFVFEIGGENVGRKV